MFNIGPSEMMMLGLLALLVFGPSKLPEIARAAGEGLRNFRKAAEDLKQEVKDAMDEEPEQPAEESEASPEEEKEVSEEEASEDQGDEERAKPMPTTKIQEEEE